MKNERYHLVIEKNEFSKFANFFIKYLNGSSTIDEAFIRAKYTYRKLFKKIPYQNCQSFLEEFHQSQQIS